MPGAGLECRITRSPFGTGNTLALHTLFTAELHTLKQFYYLFSTALMLYTIAIILIILWLLGLVTSYTLGGFIHILLVIAIILILIRLIRGENPF